MVTCGSDGLVPLLVIRDARPAPEYAANFDEQNSGWERQENYRKLSPRSASALSRLARYPAGIGDALPVPTAPPTQ